MKHIKPKIPKPIFKKPKKWLPKVAKLPIVISEKVISDISLLIINIKKWLSNLTKTGVKIGFDSFFSQFKATFWWIIIIIVIAIVAKILLS